MPVDAFAAVVIADDGELAELREVLDALGVAFVERPPATGREAGALRAELLFSTPRHALELERRRGRDTGTRAREHVVVLDAASRTLGRVLERSGCDFVLRAPVHREVYRLLVERSRYRGTERRRHPRVAFGEPVKVRVGRHSHAATLSQLSRRGCGLVLDKELEPGATLSVLLPPELTGGARLVLDGRIVVSRDPAGDESEGRHHAVVFEAIRGDAAKRLRALLLERSTAGPTLVPAGAGPAAAGRPAARAPATGASSFPASEGPSDAGGERRRSPRAAYCERVLASGGGGARVIAGRDLSLGGMRVERHPDLAVGDEVKLALYGRPGRPALLVRAVVARDAGRRGWVLQFRGLSGAVVAQLGDLVDSLPRLDTRREAGDDDADGPGVVVSEIVVDD